MWPGVTFLPPATYPARLSHAEPVEIILMQCAVRANSRFTSKCPELHQLKMSTYAEVAPKAITHSDEHVKPKHLSCYQDFAVSPEL